MNTFVFTGNETVLEAKFNEPIKVNNNQIALKMISSSYNVSNITETNNKFRFKIKENEWRDGIIPIGSYGIPDIESTMEVVMKSQDENNNELNENVWNEKIELKIDYGTGKCIIIVPKEIEIDFTVVDSVGSVLGINKVLKEGMYFSDEIIRIEPISCFMVHCDIITGSYLNGKPFQSIFQFVPNVKLGHSFVCEPFHLMFHNIPNSLREISRIKLWITDESNNTVSFNGEEITIVLVMN